VRIINNFRKTTFLVFIAVTILVSLIFVLVLGEESATSTSPKKLRVGVFESRAIAVAFAASKYNTFSQDLMKEYKDAEAKGDKKRMDELKQKGEKLQDKLHRQGFGNAPVDDLLVYIKDSFPEIAKKSGVDVIVSGVVYNNSSVEIIDITGEIVKPFNPSEKTLKIIEELRKHPPIEWDKFPIKD